jgi:hypothetical protein
MLLTAQKADLLPQKALHLWGIKAGHYSGITPIGENRYAVVSDKEPLDGFYIFTIQQDEKDGQIKNVIADTLRGSLPMLTDTAGISLRDAEGVAYFPPANSVFVSFEGDQTIQEYQLDGTPTGRELYIPEEFQKGKIAPNLGFEALDYDTIRHKFWTTTESTLIADGETANIERPKTYNLLRIQSFNDQLLPQAQYAYRMDRLKSTLPGKHFTYGVPTICALPDGRLLVMERELRVSPNYLSSHVECKIFVVNPAESYQIDCTTDLSLLDPNKFMLKKLVANFKTKLSGIAYNFGNFEGMCLGRKLSDGRQTLLLISDSQGGAGGNGFRIKDYLKVIVLND